MSQREDISQNAGRAQADAPPAQDALKSASKQENKTTGAGTKVAQDYSGKADEESDNTGQTVEDFIFPSWSATNSEELDVLHQQLIRDFRPKGLLECNEIEDLAYLLYKIDAVGDDYQDHEEKIFNALYRLQRLKEFRRRLNPYSVVHEILDSQQPNMPHKTKSDK